MTTPFQRALLLPLVLFLTISALGQQPSQGSDARFDFVTRSGSSLLLDGKPFRYSGPNIEWLGVEAYGPHDPEGPRYPSRFEIDDALDTAKQMGARVVRSQVTALLAASARSANI